MPMNVECLLLSEFDIDTGSQLSLCYPNDYLGSVETSANYRQYALIWRVLTFG